MGYSERTEHWQADLACEGGSFVSSGPVAIQGSRYV